MSSYREKSSHWSDPIVGRFLRFAAGGWVPASWFLPEFKKQGWAEKSMPMHIEVVSHCWQYAHFLLYQLSSLVNFPPQKVKVTMTVYYSNEDTNTAAVLKFFEQYAIENVEWNWQEMPKEKLFRRAIGRNHAAKNSKADWVWFTDCDLMFRENCLDELGVALEGRSDVLVFPRQERITSLLTDEDPMLSFNASAIDLKDVDTDQFSISERGRATGPLQITHGDVAREYGYCECLGYYQRPAEKWCKAYEDRAFRWLLRSQGTPLDIPGVYRIRHVFKGRYTGGKANTALRSSIRKTVAAIQKPRPEDE
ncbi:glycosyltransferase family A protein [Pleionea litopenaei]|uniref:Glycosyltransferase family A protein n=1 Tax=Pleionea litopenaei TaxID=3070815 RepID=A0AA51RRH8_9GAMM|nr:glycosyltransferase family A protein [Pleionea sp. HL-JVS1]WMS86328.1 glycosyltransferase family A protein [Pleionea sp. HL-JVS1]